MVTLMETQFQTTNPFTQKNIQTYEYEKLPDVLIRITEFSIQQKKWSALTLQQRGAHLKKVAERLRENKMRLAHQMTVEMGKPITQSIAEIEKCATGLDNYVELTSSLQLGRCGFHRRPCRSSAFGGSDAGWNGCNQFSGSIRCARAIRWSEKFRRGP